MRYQMIVSFLQQSSRTSADTTVKASAVKKKKNTRRFLSLQVEMLKGEAIFIVFANTRICINNIPKRFKDCIEKAAAKSNVISAKDVVTIARSPNVNNTKLVLSTSGAIDVDAVCRVPTTAEQADDPARLLSRDEREGTALGQVNKLIQENIFLHFQGRCAGRLTCSLTFLLLPLCLQSTNVAFFPGFPRDSVSDRTASPKISAAYLLTYGLFVGQDFLEWVVVRLWVFCYDLYLRGSALVLIFQTSSPQKRLPSYGTKRQSIFCEECPSSVFILDEHGGEVGCCESGGLHCHYIQQSSNRS